MAQQFHFWEFIQKTQNTDSKQYMHSYVHCSIIYNCQDLEAARVPISRWIDKKAVVHLHNGILPGCKKEGNIFLCNSIGRPGSIMLSEISWSEKEKYQMISLICGI